MKAKLYIVLIGLLLCATVHGQVKIGDNPQNIHPSSVLELESTTRALVVTRITTAQMNAMVPLQGAVVYNTENQCLHYYSGTAWINLCEALEDGKTFSANAVTNPIPTIIITETGNNINFEVGQITGDNIVNGSINGAVEIQFGSVTQDVLAFNSVGRDQLVDNAITSVEIDLSDVTLNTFTNDAGFITGAAIVSPTAGNVITNDNGAYYNDAVLQTGIATNSTNIATNTANIATNKTDIATNAAGLAAHIAADGDLDATNEIQTLAEVLTEGNAANNSITNLTNPTNPQDAATKFYVDNALAGPGIDNQQLTLEAGNLLTLENGGTPINLTPFLDNTDNQTITDFTFDDATRILSIELQNGGVPQTVNLTSLAGGAQDLADVLALGTDANGLNITNLADPVLDQDAATKAYVDAISGGAQDLADVLALGTDANSLNITNLADPVLDQDAATKAYVDAISGGAQDLADVLALGTDANGLNIANLADPLLDQDAATKGYVDAALPNGTPTSLFFADTDGTAITPEDTGLPLNNRALYWDPTSRFNSGALFVGVNGFTQSTIAKVHIQENDGSGVLRYPLQIQNRGTGTLFDSNGSSVGLLFAVEGGGSFGKGSLVYERKASFGRGDFHFLQNVLDNVTNPTNVSFSVMTVKNNGNVIIAPNSAAIAPVPTQKFHVEGTMRLTGQFFDETNAAGTLGQILSSTPTGTAWINPPPGGGGTLNSLDGSVIILPSGVADYDFAVSAESTPVVATPVNYTIPVDETNVEGHLAGIDAALGLVGGTDDQTAAEVAYTNTTSGLIAMNVQAAIDELAATGGAADGVVTNIATSGTLLQVTGANGGFNGNLDLEPLVDLAVANNNYLITELDGDPTNELQTLSLVGTDLTLSNGGGTVSIPGGVNDGVVTNIATSGTLLQVTGANGGFNGNLDLEPLVDLAVANNNYLITELDGDPTNELQDITSNDGSIVITPNGNDFDLSVSIDLQGAMEVDGLDVGIGIAPTERLHVNGNIRAEGGLSVGGDILLNGNGVVPDYVFQKYFLGSSSLKPTYEFVSLSEIEEFIKVNHHLPGIPSAANVKAQGFWDLGKAAHLNLEKIEELYLHTINQEKEIEKLKSSNETLSSELEALKKDLAEIKKALSKE